MADARDLSLAFLEAHSAEGARVLETLPTADASALFASLPERLGARVLAAMLSTSAARVLTALHTTSAQALLNGMGAPAAVAILRHVPEPDRAQFIAGLPPASALASQMLLGFPDDTVGAWTDHEAAAFAPNSSADAAVRHIRSDAESDLDRVYVVDAGRRLQGFVTLRALVRAPGAAMLRDLAQPVATPLSIMMTLAAVRGLGAWENTTVLPVVDHDMRLIGVLRRATLANALRRRGKPVVETPGADAVTGALAASYWDIFSALSGATLALLPAVKRVLPEDR